MRILLPIFFASLLLPKYAGAETAAQPLTCFENLAAPEFPAAALQAHVDGTVWTTTHVSSTGAIEKIDTQVVSAWGTAPKLLTAPVEAAIRKAKIKPACNGKEVPVVFRYELHGEEVANPKPTSRTENPNIVWIESEPAKRVTKGAVKTPANVTAKPATK